MLIKPVLILCFFFKLLIYTDSYRTMPGEFYSNYMPVVFEQTSHQDNMSVCFIPPYISLLYSKTGVYRGKHYFLIFALKQLLWVLVRTASLRRSNVYPQYIF